MEERPEPMGYRPALDGLRAFAVAVVVGWHYFGRPASGWLGVDLFFVLSGFLITRLLLEEHLLHGRISLSRFYARRALRLVPALYAFLLVFLSLLLLRRLGLQAVIPGPADVVPAVGLAASYLTNAGFSLGWIHIVDTNHLWSLAVEEQF